MLALLLHRSRACGNRPRLYTSYIRTRTAAVPLIAYVWCCSISRQRNLFLYCCDMYLRFRGCPVVLDIELSVSAWYQKKYSTCTAAREAYSAAAASCSRGGGGWCGVRHNFQTYMQNKITFLCQSEHATSHCIRNTPTLKSIFLTWKLPL